MDCQTGELTALSREFEKRFRPVPQELQVAAKKVLGDLETVTVDLAGDSELARWARAERLKDRAQEIAKATRRMKDRVALEAYISGHLLSAVREELRIAASGKDGASAAALGIRSPTDEEVARVAESASKE